MGFRRRRGRGAKGDRPLRRTALTVLAAVGPLARPMRAALRRLRRAASRRETSPIDRPAARPRRHDRPGPFPPPIRHTQFIGVLPRDIDEEKAR